MTSQDMSQVNDPDPTADGDVVEAELIEDAGAVAPRVPVVGIDPEYVDLYRRLRAEGGVDLQEQLHARYLELARGGVTAGGLPYPSPTDPVAEGADAIRALAEAVDAKVADTGWVPLTPLQGFTAGTGTAIRRIGNVTFYRGVVTRDAGNFTGTLETIFELEARFRPAAYSRFVGVGSASVWADIVITAAGSVQTRQGTGTTYSAVYLSSIVYPNG